MRALSIRQPWASLIVDGHKDIENRDWFSAHKGWVLIHAGKTCTQDDWDDVDFSCILSGVQQPRPLEELQRGGIIGYAYVSGCVKDSKSPWFCGKYGFVLSHQAPLNFVPHKGVLGFFDVPGSFTVPTPRVLNRHHLPNKGWPLPPGAVYVGRGTPWGNPFWSPRDPDPLRQFGDYVFDSPELIERIRRELRGKHLICSCAPRPCHGDILRIIANTDTSDIDELVRLCRMEILIKTL